MREAYSYLSTNWLPGDEIFLFGFSRGAFTARSVAGLIGEIGMLTREGMPYLAEIFRDVQHEHDAHYKPKHPDVPFPDKPSAADPAYRRELQRRGLTQLGVSIKVIGVWETVGSLGTPRIGWLEKIGIQSTATKRMSFYDTSLSDCVEYAFQALALDERRASFRPAVWEKMEGNTSVLRQVWFPGVHSNVGGGYDDQEVANITLAWMMSQIEPFLDMDIDYLFQQRDANDEYYEKHEKKIRPWSFGKIYNSLTGIYALGGALTRTPGRYFVIDPNTGRETDEPLQDTHEYVHASVRSRIKLGGPGVDDRGRYDCKAMRDWKLYIEQAEDGTKKPSIFWKLRTKQRNVTTRVLPEAPLWDLELDLLDADPDTYDYVVNPSGVRQRRRSRSRRPD